MHGFRILALVAIIAISFAVVPSPAEAWGNGTYSVDPNSPRYGIHDWIADKALTFQTANVQFLLTTYHADYLIGTEAPDNGAYIGDSYNHHVYYSTTGGVQSDVGATRARAMYQLSLSSLRSSDFEQAAFYAGAMAHYISDPGAYGHTMGSSTVWGTSPHHGDYEDHVHTMLGSLSDPTPTTLVLTDAYNATLDLARKTTFGSGSIRANTWMESNYNWSDPVFKASCRESLNESVKAVATALGLLLVQGGVSTIPEFGSEGLVVIVICIPATAYSIWVRKHGT